MTSRGIGGGHKQKLRLVDFKRNKFGIEAKVAAIEYDPAVLPAGAARIQRRGKALPSSLRSAFRSREVDERRDGAAEVGNSCR